MEYLSVFNAGKYGPEKLQIRVTFTQYCNDDLYKFVLLKKGVYPYKYIDIWTKFTETSLLNK